MSDRSNTERIRRLKATAIAKGPYLNQDHNTFLMKQFGESRYFYQKGNGSIKEESCCDTSVQYVAVGDKILYSYNGITWFESDAVFSGYGYGVAYGGDKWVAVGYNDGPMNVKYSYDGIKWTDVSGANTTVYSVAYGKDGDGNPLWLATQNDISGTDLIRSSDGITWANNGSLFGGGGGYCIAYNGSRWVAGGGNGSAIPTIQWSSNGTSWNVPTINSSTTYVMGVAYGGNKWAAACYNDSSNYTMLYSPDGTEWDQSSGPQFGSYGGISIAYGNKWIARGDNVVSGDASGNTILQSPDGVTWARTYGTQLGGGGYYGGVTYGDKWVTVGLPNDEGVTMVWSPDGNTWQPTKGASFGGGGGYGVAYKG